MISPSRVAALVLVLALALAPAAAAADPGWARSWEQAREEARLRNAPVLLAVLDDEAASDAARDLLEGRRLARHLDEAAVVAVAHPGSHDERTRGGEPRCRLYGAIPCAAHHVTADQAAPLFPDGLPDAPRLVVVVDGRVAAELAGDAEADAVRAALADAQAALGGEAYARSAVEEAREDLADGDARVERGRFDDAIRSYRSVADDEAVPPPLRAEARGRLEAVLQAALDAVEQAKALGGRRARKALRRLLREFGDLKAARAAIEEALDAVD